jgi:hypothetical protein
MKRILMYAALLAVLATDAGAQIPRLISYQGYLTDANGSPITGTRTLTFALYTAPSGPASPVWLETHQNVAITNGTFEIYLGINTTLSLIPFDVAYYLGTKVNSDPELVPRTRFASAPYALRALSSEVASSHWTQNGNNLVAGVPGNIGIGTIAPTEKVHIASTGVARLFLQADTDNAGETDNPGIRMSQDGGAVIGRLGYASGLNKLEIMNEFGDEVLFGTGNVTQLALTPEAELQWRAPNGNYEVQIRPSSPSDPGGEILMRDSEASPHTTVQIDAEHATGEGSIGILYNHAGSPSVVLDAEEGVNGGAVIKMYDFDGTQTIELDAQETSTNGADISLFRADGALGIQLDANYSATGTSRIITDVLQIQGGSDLSENFQVNGIGAPEAALGAEFAGMVVSIDPERPGELEVSDRAYDRRVAGIVSGAGDVRTGMLMGQAGSIADGAQPVALTGRVYCWVDADRGGVEPGDLLTTSQTPGHAMKASDASRGHGAILGKAMTALKSGKGLVLVLVNLQ